MSALAGTRAHDGRIPPKPRAPERRRTLAGYVWFALMIVGWFAFFSLIAFSDATLDSLHDDLRALPLLGEVVVWFLIFPFTLALTVWESAWEPATRWALVVCISLAWSAMFFPRKRLP